jgi:putative hydrolase of the HAD superfamily
VRFRGVIFDLWDTLVDWPVDDGRAHIDALQASLRVDDGEFQRLWQEGHRARQTGSLAAAYEAMGISSEQAAAYVDERHEITRKALHPRDGAIATLDKLRRTGHRVGLITMCSEDVPAVWSETPFAGRFDAETFSARCGLVKPEPEIYLTTARELGLDPHECVFVGDGANDELRGAREVGMTPVLMLPDGREPWWDEVRDWDGLRIAEIPDVLALV